MINHIDATIFLPGHISNNDEDIDVPLLKPDQIEVLLELYKTRGWYPFFPYLGAVLPLMRSGYVTPTTPLVNRWVPIIQRCEHKLIEQILSLLLVKYGWDIPQRVVDRCIMYAKRIMEATGNGGCSAFTTDKPFHYYKSMDSDDFALARIMYQLKHDKSMEHLTYLATHCLETIESVKEVSVNDILSIVGKTAAVPSPAILFEGCVKALVDICVSASYIGVPVKLSDKIVNSDPFRICLLFQPLDLLNYFCGDMSLAKRFELGAGVSIRPIDKNLAKVIVKKRANDGRHDFTLALTGLPAVHEMDPSLAQMGQMVLGLNPNVGEYWELARKGNYFARLWYCGALSLGSDMPNNRQVILKALAGLWRLQVSNYTHVPVRCIPEIAKRVGATIEDILKSSYSIRMSSIGWAMKDIMSIYEAGIEIGSTLEHMINVFMIKHAKKTQSITGLQQISEVINGNK